MTVDDSLKERLTAAWRARHGGGGGGGGGPYDPQMDARIFKLETGQEQVRLSLARIEELLKHVATATDVARVEGKVDTLDAKVAALDGRLGRVETDMMEAVRTAVGKTIGPVQLPMVVGACIVVVGGLMTGVAWLATKLGILHP